MNRIIELIDPAATAWAGFLVGGLILSCGIYFLYRILGPLLVNFRRGSAATAHRVLVLLFVVLVFTPVLSFLKPFSQEITSPKPQAFAAVDAVSDAGIPATANSQSPKPSGNAPELFAAPASKWIESAHWPILLAASWAITVSILLVRLIFSLAALRTLHRRVRILPLPPGLPCRRRIQLAESTLVEIPIAVGLWSPKVLLPPDLAAELSGDDWHRVLHHEIAHLERYDDWSNLLERLSIALNPFNPFLWLVGNELQEVREIVCDDWVLARFNHAESYAELLARLATGGARASTLAAGASRAGRQLYRRLSRILDLERDRDLRPCLFTTVLAGIGLVASSAVALLLLPVVVFAPSVRADEAHAPIGSVVQTQANDNKQPAQAGKTVAADPEIIALLKHSAETDNDPRVRDAAIASLCAINGDQATDALLQLLDESKEDRAKVLVLYGLDRDRISDTKVRGKLKEFAFGNASLPVRFAALDQLAAAGDDSATDQFLSIYRSAAEKPIKERCLLGLARIGSKASKDFLMATAKDDPDPEMRLTALRALADPGSVEHNFTFMDGIPSPDGRHFRVLLGEHIAGDPGNLVGDVIRQKLEIATGKLRRPDLGGWMDGGPPAIQIPPDGFTQGTLIPHGPPVPPPLAAPERVPESGSQDLPPPPEP